MVEGKRVETRNAFEVFVNDKLLFSKIQTYGYPVEKEIIQAITDIQSGGEVKQLTNSANPGCLLL